MIKESNEENIKIMQVNDYQLNQLQEKDELIDKHNNELNEVQQRFKHLKRGILMFLNKIET